MRDIAEQVLFADTLQEKLSVGPLVASDEVPGTAISLPDGPGRPSELRIHHNGVKVDFPGTHHLDDDRERGMLLHFLANHELLAAELMALVLLRFPDAPKEYRKGVYEAMREEQMHALMYVRRMRECGIAFGELPVSDYFWRVVAPMETPMDFVTRLNLTFEQANLDFSRHYASLFRQVGDTATAAVLEKIHLDEIGHVGHGVKWFRRWKQRGETDWDGYRRCLSFPLTPARAKGRAPFHAESRRQAGIAEDFIRQLEVCEVSRGRTPVMFWFNPNAESHARASALGKRWQPDKASLALEQDLEMLMLACCRRDDALLMRRPPSVDHLRRIKEAGFGLPEIVSVDASPGRPLGGLRPWAWSPDAINVLQPFAKDVAEGLPHQWRDTDRADWFSKEIGLQLEQSLGPVPETGLFLDEVDAVESAIAERIGTGNGAQVVLKAPYACAGRGHLRVNSESVPSKTRGWIENTLAAHGGLVAEPWLDRVLDFSSLYEVGPEGMVDHVAFTVMENDAAGRFQGTKVARKWGNLLPEPLAAFFFREANILDLYTRQLPGLIGQVVPGYSGPLGIDAMVHLRADGSLALKPVVEVNVRFTMGRLAWQWLKHSGQSSGSLQILQKAAFSAEEISRSGQNGLLPINDPEQAGQFIACWSGM